MVCNQGFPRLTLVLMMLVVRLSLSAAFRRTILGNETGTKQGQSPTIDAWEFLQRQSARVSCTADAASKRTCLFNNVCFIPAASSNSSQPAKLLVVLPLKPGNNSSSSSSNRSEAMNMTISLLQQHLEQALAGQTYTKGIHITENEDWAASRTTDPLGCSGVNCTAAQSSVRTILESAWEARSHGNFSWEEGVTVLWRPVPHNQESFGHMLINEAYPLFMVLNNQFSNLPHQLQLIVSADGWVGPVLPHTLSRMISHRTMLWRDKLEQAKQHGRAGVCIRHLLLGDGGYIGATRASLSNSGAAQAHIYSVGPSFFSNRNWLSFRAYTMQVAGVLELPQKNRPLILLNDKRYHELANGQYQQRSDRRMILDIENLVASIQSEYTTADVVAARFRDLSWPDQLRLLSQASVFITTQGSSAFRWVWLRPGATVIVLGAPNAFTPNEWKNFHELDKWFPLHYIRFEKYLVDINKTGDYKAQAEEWQKGDRGQQEWWLYNSDVRVQMDRLRPLLDKALGF